MVLVPIEAGVKTVSIGLGAGLGVVLGEGVVVGGSSRKGGRALAKD